MKKKLLSAVFVIACLSACVVPSVGMIFAPSNEAIGNEQQTTLPSVRTEDGGYNEKYFQELGSYFSTHYALRPQIMSADAEIQSEVFGTSNIDSVVVGKNNWLYYSSTLDNFLGKNLMSSRAIYNTKHNLEMTQDYLAKNNIEFLFTIAPNKNTLYPENMPYYYGKKESTQSNLKNFVLSLKDSELNYCDLLTPLDSYDEVLYHEQDSHWNNKGALIAYNEILDSLNKPHNNYENATATRSKSFYGDLGKMLYPSTQQPEYNYEYDINPTYSYVTPTKSVEDAIINTQNDSATGRLYMYRDSFGNAILPYFANAYNSAYFTKTFPVNLALEVGIQKSDTVIFEIVERNLVWFAQSPPVIPAPEVSVPMEEATGDSKIKNIKAEVSSVNMQYVSITGEIDSKLCKDNSSFTVVVRDKDNNKRAYEAFTTSNESSDYCFQAFIPAQYLNNSSVEVCVVINTDNDYLTTVSCETEILQAEI